MESVAAVISDCHIPHHDQKACDVMKGILSVVNPDILIINGDLVDFAQISSFDRQPGEILTLQEDLTKAKKWLKELRQSVPHAEIIYLLGNHEDRLQRYLNKHPEIHGLDCLKIENLLDLAVINCQLIPKNEYKWHDWLITHGDVVRANAGATAQALITKYGMNGVCGHVHRLALVQKTNFSRTLTWIEGGCLSRLDPQYMKVADWQQGCTILRCIDGQVYPELVRINDGKAFYQGAVYKV